MTIFGDPPARALAIYAHPDDPEVSCGGTLAKWSGAGAEVRLLVCNAGDKGSNDPATDPENLVAVRADEVAAAAAVMGLAGHALLGVPDGELDNTVGLRAEIVARIRAMRPDVVVAPDPVAVFFGDAYVNHHDHRALGWAVLDACAPMAASPLYFPDAGPAHRVQTLLLSGTLEPDCWIDIADTLADKLEAVACHRTQLPAGDHAHEMVEEVVRVRAEEAGRAAGLRLAEGFRRLVLAG